MAFYNGAPIIIVAFNRADYLDRVLVSIKNQNGEAIDDKQVHLVLDGAVNEFSGIRYANDIDLDESAKIFFQHFPNGNLHRSEHNIGVARNFARAEAIAFEQNDHNVAFFFEDDLELGPSYFKVMEKLANISIKQPVVGYFAAYGSPGKKESDQNNYGSDVQFLEHHWAFGLTRAQWERSKPYVEQYMELVGSVDYRQRDTKSIARMMESWGIGSPGASQDAVKAAACQITGGVKINTRAAYGRYIGETGLNFTPAVFESLGFKDSEVLKEDRFYRDQLTGDEIRILRRRMYDYVNHIVVKDDEEFAGKTFYVDYALTNTPLFSATEIIQAFYSTLLGRNADEPGLASWAARLTHRRDLEDTFGALAQSPEYISKKNARIQNKS